MRRAHLAPKAATLLALVTTACGNPGAALSEGARAVRGTPDHRIFAQEASLPFGFPAGVPVYPGARFSGVIAFVDWAGRHGWTATWLTADAPQRVLHFYVTTLPGAGWYAVRLPELSGVGFAARSLVSRQVSNASVDLTVTIQPDPAGGPTSQIGLDLYDTRPSPDRLPPGMSEVLPLYPQSTFEWGTASLSTAGRPNFNALWSSQASLDRVATYYVAELSRAPWSVTSQRVLPAASGFGAGGLSIDFRHTGRDWNGTLYLGVSGDRTQIDLVGR